MINSLQLTGISHKTASLEKRESFIKSLPHCSELLQHMPDDVKECVMVSTCNRTEIYTASKSPINAEKLLPHWPHQDCLYAYSGSSVAQHLFEMTASLDSLVIGETQILGQVRKAYEEASQAGMTGPCLNPLFQGALAAAKKVHTHTALGQGHVSVGSVAVDLCNQVYSNFKKTAALLVGSGEMGKLVLENLKAAGMQQILIASRHDAHAEELAQALGGRMVNWSDWKKNLTDVQVVVTAASSPDTLLQASDLEPLQQARGWRPLLICDIAVPRNVSTDVDDLRGVYRHDMDSLSQIVTTNTQERLKIVDDCRLRLSDDVQQLIASYGRQDFSEFFKELETRNLELQEGEFERIQHLIPPEHHDTVREALRRLGNKLLHPVKNNAAHVDTTREDLERILFGNSK